ncbi:hypothetical protein MTO96_034813, partial [Rhipicephalus appendiculatus]
MPSEGTTVTSAPGPSGEQTKKLRHRLDDVGSNKFRDADDDYEACEPFLGDFPSAKRSKPTASNAVMECDDESEDDASEDLYDDEQEDEEDDDEDDSADLEILDVDEEDDPEDFKVHTTEENNASRRVQSGSRRKIDHAEGIRLEDYLPEHLIDSHEKRDRCSLAITMTHTARSVDITELSGDIIKLVFKGNKSENYGTSHGSPPPRPRAHSKAFVRYMDPETAAATLKIIENAIGKGKVLRVERCTTRKQTTLGNMLDLFRLPFNCTVARLKQQFPCSRVCVLKHGFARRCFNSTEDPKRAVQSPGCHTIDVHQIRLSLVKELVKEGDYHGGGRQSRDSRGNYD